MGIDVSRKGYRVKRASRRADVEYCIDSGMVCAWHGAGSNYVCFPDPAIGLTRLHPAWLIRLA
jgi:hypothetical protein